MDETNEVRDLPLLRQLYTLFEESLERGVSEVEVTKHFGQTKLNGRALIRNLLKDGKIEYYTTHHGRQTIRRLTNITFIHSLIESQ